MLVRSDKYVSIDRSGTEVTVGIGSHSARTAPEARSTHKTLTAAFYHALTIVAAKHCRVRRVVIYLEEKK